MTGLKQCGIIIDRQTFFKQGDNKIIQLYDSMFKYLSKQDAWRYNNNADNINDIKDLNYKIENEFIVVNNF